MTGIFETGHYLHDSEFLLVPIHVGQELYGLGDALHGLTVKTTDPYGAESVKQEIQKFLQPPEYAQTWIDMNKQYFEAVRLERTVMFFLLFFIIIVAAFGIMNTLITVTVQKTRDIGIMKAIGANIRQIVWVFLGQGVIVGFRHAGRAWARHDADPIPQRIQPMARQHSRHRGVSQTGLPVLADPGRGDPDGCRQDLHRCLHCLLRFRLLPAYRAARLDPVTALRYE